MSKPDARARVVVTGSRGALFELRRRLLAVGGIRGRSARAAAARISGALEGRAGSLPIDRLEIARFLLAVSDDLAKASERTTSGPERDAWCDRAMIAKGWAMRLRRGR